MYTQSLTGALTLPLKVERNKTITGTGTKTANEMVPSDEKKMKQDAEMGIIEKLVKSDNPILKAAGAQIHREHAFEKCNQENFIYPDMWSRVKNKKDVAICVQIKNDAHILDEFVAFHWIQGVGKFVIYDDNSIDQPYDILQTYVDLGIVEYKNLSGHVDTGSNSLQANNYNECFARLRLDYEKEHIRWILFPDIDEFFLSNIPGETLTQTLNNNYDDAPCAQIMRTWFGSSYYHKHLPKGALVTEHFILASPVGADGFPKMMANIYPSNATTNATALFSVHNIVEQAKVPCRFSPNTKDLRINHYVRTLQDYETKILTGHKVLDR